MIVGIETNFINSNPLRVSGTEVLRQIHWAIGTFGLPPEGGESYKIDIAINLWLNFLRQVLQ